MRGSIVIWVGLALLAPHLVLSTGDAQARTWRVWKDGSGDFTVIQDAVDAAAPGDTVLIGPGRYTESSIFPYDGEGIEGETFVGIDKDDLTLMGVHRDSVVIGPWEPNFAGFLPKGIAMKYQSATRLRIERMTVRNVREGLRLLEVAWISDCATDSCDLGILGGPNASIAIEQSKMSNCFDQGSIFFDGLSTIIRACEVTGNFLNGLNFVHSQAVSISDCSVSGSRAGIHFQQGSSGEVLRTEVRDTPEIGIIVQHGSTAHVERTTLEGAEEGIWVSASTLTGQRNRLGPFTLHVMNMLGDSSVTMTQNDFILGSTPSIRLDGYLPEPPTVYLDFTNNWWGTTDPDEIAGQIRDKNDDDTIDGVVTFEPFRSSTAPIKQESMSSFKALFGGR